MWVTDDRDTGGRQDDWRRPALDTMVAAAKRGSRPARIVVAAAAGGHGLNARRRGGSVWPSTKPRAAFVGYS